MDKSFCKRIDEEFLVEDYVAGKLFGELHQKFEQHISECEEHANAVSLEKALRRGVREYARSELKSRIHSRIRKREDIRLIVLRFAAFLFVAVITPLILYYQFGILQQESELSLPTETVKSDLVISQEDMEEEPIEPLKVAKKSVAAAPEKKSIDDLLSGGAGVAEKLVEPITSDDAEAVREADLPPADEYRKQELISVHQSLELPTVQSKQKGSGVRGVSLPAKREESSLLVFAEDDSLQPAIAEKILPQLQLYQKDIHDCLQSLLETNEKKEYHLLVEFIIRTDGKTQSVKIVKTDTELKDAETCIEEKIKNWRFAPGESEYRVQKLFDSRYKYQY